MRCEPYALTSTLPSQTHSSRLYRTKYSSWNFGSMPYNARFKMHRRLFEQHFRASVIPKYHTQLTQATLRILQNMVDDPSDFYQILHMYVVRVLHLYGMKYRADSILRGIGSIILDLVYGYKTKPKNDEWVNLSDQVLRDMDIAHR